MEDKFKLTENILKEYKKNKAILEHYKREFEKFKNNVNLSAIDYSKTKISPTYKITSAVENEAVHREEIYDAFKRRIEEFSDKVFIVENAMNILNEREKFIIEKRYFEKAKNIDIAVELNLTEEYVCDLKRGIVNKLSEMLFLT